MNATEPKKDSSAPAPVPNGAVPRNGSGADTAFMAMVKKRKGRDGDAEAPQPIQTQRDKPKKK